MPLPLPCSTKDLKRYIDNAVEVDPERPVLVDKYLDRADELDVDALADKDGNVVICGIMQHIEQAGVHSGGGHLMPSALAGIAGMHWAGSTSGRLGCTQLMLLLSGRRDVPVVHTKV